MATTASLRVLIPGSDGGREVLDLWQTVQNDASGVVWQVDVTGGLSQMERVLEASLLRLAAEAKALPATQARLQHFLDQYRGPDVSFTTPMPYPREPERRLAMALAPSKAAFGLGDSLADALRQAREFSEQVQRVLGQAALVRTTVDGRVLGATRVTWSGDAQTCWDLAFSRAESAVHERAVRLALATSQAWLRIATLLGATAVQLSLLLPTGLGALKALPAAWGFITALLEEYRRLRRL